MTVPDIREAECLHAPDAVESAIRRMGREITARLDGRECLVLCVLQGGIVPAGMLLPAIDAPLQLDSVHVTRYRNTTRGGEVEWRVRPRTPVGGRRVLVVDDILDEGHSLAAIRQWLSGEGAEEILMAVLVDKQHDRKHPDLAVDHVGLTVPDRYVFGYGMDYRGWHRNAPGIFAAPA